jgi:hypothetical protein
MIVQPESVIVHSSSSRIFRKCRQPLMRSSSGTGIGNGPASDEIPSASFQLHLLGGQHNRQEDLLLLHHIWAGEGADCGDDVEVWCSIGTLSSMLLGCHH